MKLNIEIKMLKGNIYLVTENGFTYVCDLKQLQTILKGY